MNPVATLITSHRYKIILKMVWEALEKGEVEKDIRSAEEDSFSDDGTVRAFRQKLTLEECH